MSLSPGRFENVEQAENNALEDVRQRHVFFSGTKNGDVEGDERNLAYWITVGGFSLIC